MPSVLISVPLNRISCEVWQMMSSVSTYFTFWWNSVGSCSSRENGTKKATFAEWVRGLVSAAAVSELSSLTYKRNVCSAAEALNQRTSFTWDPGGNVSLRTLSSHLGQLVLKQASSSGFVPVCASECGLTWLNNSVRWRMDVLSGRSFSLLQEPDYICYMIIFIIDQSLQVSCFVRPTVQTHKHIYLKSLETENNVAGFLVKRL